MTTSPITTIPEALDWCQEAKYEFRTQHGGLGETSYWIYLNGAYHSYWGDKQFLDWVNATIQRTRIRRAAGWETHPLFGWVAPDGTPEAEWAEAEHPFPEDEGYADFLANYRPFHEPVG